MSKEITVVTNGTFSLEETKVENQFHFFRNDHEVLGNVGTLPIEMFARYLIYKAREGQIEERFDREILFELSADSKILRLTVSEKTKPNLRVVKTEESKVPEVREPSYFKRVFAKFSK